VSVTVWWSVTFFFASAGASAAYLTVSEIFPLEIRASAISFFYAIGTALGGILGPLLFAAYVESGDTGQVFIGYIIAAVAMAFGGVMGILIGVKAEKESLEDVAEPLSAQDGDGRRGS
jgi:MFS family permease